MMEFSFHVSLNDFEIRSLSVESTFGEIPCSDWLRRVMCRTVIFRYWTFVSHFVYKATTKENFEKPQQFNEFSKLSTKLCMSRTMNNLKESFSIKKEITTRTTTKLKMTVLSRYIYVCIKVSYVVLFCFCYFVNC